MALDREHMIEAGGGNSDTTSIARARERGARVRIARIDRRRDKVAVLRPKRLPWARGTSIDPAGEDLIHLEAASSRPKVPPIDHVFLANGEMDALPGYLPIIFNIFNASEDFEIQPSIIAALGSKESPAGRLCDRHEEEAGGAR